MPDALMDRVMSVYREVDLDGDGFLDKQELTAMLDAVGVPLERANKLFDLADHDVSGSIDFEEFCTWLFSDAKGVMDVTIKKGEIINKHLKMEMLIGDVLCYGMPEERGCRGHSYEVSVQPDEQTIRHLEQRAKFYAEARAKEELDALTKTETDAKAKLEALLSKAQAAQAKAKAKADAKAKEKAEEKANAEAEAISAAEETLQAATAAKVEAEAKPLAIEPVLLLEQVFDDSITWDDKSSGTVRSRVLKFKAKEAGTALVKVCQRYTCAESPDAEAVEKVEEYDFTVTVEGMPEGSTKPDWFAWSWYDVKWVKAPANKADKFAKKMGKAGEELQWVSKVYGPKKEKLHVQSTFCFSPKVIEG